MIGVVNKDFEIDDGTTIKVGTVIYNEDAYMRYNTADSTVVPETFCTDGTNDFFTNRDNITFISEIYQVKKLICLINKYNE